MADTGTPDPIIREAREFWRKVSASEDPQRKRILAAKKFRALDQWPTAIKLAREGAGGIGGQAPQPARPCLVVDRLSQPVRQVSNTIKNADFGFDVMPNGQGADIETAEIFKGYLRRVQNQSRGESPIEWAADGAIEGGIGWFRLLTDYAHEAWDGDPSDPEAYDLELRMARIANNLTVYCDPAATRPTRSDARRMLVTEDMDREDFLVKYPKADVRGLDEFLSTGDMQGWVSDDVIRIAEFWRIRYEDRPIYVLQDGTSGEGTPPKDAPVQYERVIRKPIVEGFKINACEVLEKWDWAGSRIPLIPILGEELNVDGKPVLRGIIEPGMDAQRMVNYTYSAGVEIFALSNKKAPMVPMGSIAQYKTVWDARTTTNFSYLPYDPFDADGRPMPPPVLDTTESPIQAAVMLMQTSEEAIKATTSTGDASLGNSNPNERSGRALQALQSQSDLANSNYPDNVRRALIYAAELMVEIIPKITRPGQILQILGMDDEPKQVMVGKPFKEGENGIPEPAPEDITPEIAKMKASLYKFYDPTAGRYSVTVTVGKATATRREEGAMALGELIPHLPPEMAAVATPDYVEQLSFPGAHKIAEKLRKVLPAHLQDQEQGQQPDPQQLAMQLQQAQAQLQQAAEMIKTDQVKIQGAMQQVQLKEQGEMQRADIDAKVKIEIARMDNATKLQIEEYKLRGTMMQAELDAREQALGAQQQREAQDHERGMAAAGAQHESQEAAQGRQHESAEAQQAREAAEAQQQAGMSHEAAMQAQQQQAAAAQAAQAEAGT